MQRQKFNTLGGLNIQSTWCLECDSYMHTSSIAAPRYSDRPQIRNYAPNMIQKRKEAASLVKRGHSASNVTIKTYKCPLPHHAT